MTGNLKNKIFKIIYTNNKAVIKKTTIKNDFKNRTEKNTKNRFINIKIYLLFFLKVKYKF